MVNANEEATLRQQAISILVKIIRSFNGTIQAEQAL
jgi:hypothetical protein